MIIDYREKEDACNVVVNGLRAKNRKLRRDGKGRKDRMDVVSQIHVLEAQKMAHVQTQVDISTIQDYLGI